MKYKKVQFLDRYRPLFQRSIFHVKQLVNIVHVKIIGVLSFQYFFFRKSKLLYLCVRMFKYYQIFENNICECLEKLLKVDCYSKSQTIALDFKKTTVLKAYRCVPVVNHSPIPFFMMVHISIQRFYWNLILRKCCYNEYQQSTSMT